MKPDTKIISFIDEQKNLTLCTCINNTPYCANCFYVLLKDENFLVFKSEEKTTHIQQALNNKNIAGTILPDINKIGTIKGVQFTGSFFIPADDILLKAKKKYYTKFPVAAAIKSDFWAIELTSIKMTDNTLGFGRKLLWEK